MINDAYNRGRAAAFARFKLAQGMGSPAAGAGGANPMLGGQAAAGTQPQPASTMAPPASAAPPMALGASKAQALG